MVKVKVKVKEGILRRSVGRMLISLSQAVEPVGGYTTVTHGQCDARPTVTFQT